MSSRPPSQGVGAAAPIETGWYSQGGSSIGDFRSLVEVSTTLADYPYADDVVQNVVIYGARLLEKCDEPVERRVVQAELARALQSGPGMVVFKGAFSTQTTDLATDIFVKLIGEQKRSGGAPGDHFARPGDNDRVWNALEKLAVHSPETFVDYYQNEFLALVSEAWLGPHYQVTSQINVVNPGATAQVAHRDYHLGLQHAALYPAQVHTMSAYLTLQGAVAHVDMPVETGPTLYLPHSQKYAQGYLACHEKDFLDYFDENRVQLPLERGDAVFFNPALFHGAGSNLTQDVRRMANLLQVSSAFGRAMETVDNTTVCKAIFPTLSARVDAGWSTRLLDNVITAGAEGYPFPTDLDRDQPRHALAPQSQAELMHEALEGRWDQSRLDLALDEHQDRRRR